MNYTRDLKPFSNYREVRLGNVSIEAVDVVSDDWARRAWTSCVVERTGSLHLLPLSDDTAEGEAVVKVYRRRPNHGVLRRLRAGRAFHEGQGYMAFAEHGLRSARMLLWGEERKWGLFQAGIVVTVKVNATTVAEDYAQTRDESLLHATLDELATIHRAGLAHGDPRTRNFLAIRPRPLAFDLPSWSFLTRSSQAQDLVRFLGSVIALTGDAEKTHALLSRYEQAIPDLTLPMGTLYERAVDYATAKGER